MHPKIEIFVILMTQSLNIEWMIDRLYMYVYTVLHPANEFFTITGEGLQNIGLYAQRSRPLSREGSLLCHTCCDTGPQYFLSHPKGRPF
jgi:hypothetical protein